MFYIILKRVGIKKLFIKTYYMIQLEYDYDDSCNIRTRFLNYPDTCSSIIRTSILETYGQLFLKYADSYS